jgi:hypothetical protein
MPIDARLHSITSTPIPGDDMADRNSHNPTRRWAAPALIAVVFTMLIVSAAGAADRVVLGEYFTNLF